MKRCRRILPLLFGLVICLAVQSASAFAKDRKEGEAKIRALNEKIVAANEARDLPAALQAAEEAVRVAKAEFGEKSLEAADTINNLASLYLHLKRSAEAERLYQQSILIYLDKTDKEGAEMASSFMNLGVAYAMQKKYTKAIDILNRALTIRLKKLGPDDEATKNTEQMIADLRKLAYPNAEVL